METDIPGPGWLTSLAIMVYSRFRETLCLQKQVVSERGRYLELTSGLHMGTYRCTYQHNTHIHEYTHYRHGERQTDGKMEGRKKETKEERERGREKGKKEERSHRPHEMCINLQESAHRCSVVVIPDVNIALGPSSLGREIRVFAVSTILLGCILWLPFLLKKKATLFSMEY